VTRLERLPDTPVSPFHNTIILPLAHLSYRKTSGTMTSTLLPLNVSVSSGKVGEFFRCHTPLVLGGLESPDIDPSMHSSGGIGLQSTLAISSPSALKSLKKLLTFFYLCERTPDTTIFFILVMYC
jgi:hypothetical protein